MNKKIILGIIILAAISMLVYLYITGFFGDAGDAGITPGSNSIEIPSPPPLPD